MEQFRFTHVDLLRGLCAILVLLTHFALFAHVDNSLWGVIASPPAYSILFLPYVYGRFAVQMFWALSGFVFVIAYRNEGRDISAPRFAAWRFSRLYPLHLATFVIMAALQAGSQSLLGEQQIYLFNTWATAAYHLLFVSGWIGNADSYNAVIWSVSVEIFVYAAFVVYMKTTKPTVLISMAVALLSVVGAHFTDSPILWCASFFFVGCAVASATLFLRNGSRFNHFIVAVGVLVASGFISVILRHVGLIVLSRGAIGYGGFAGLLLCASFADIYRRPVTPRLRWLGDITYAVYLIHMPLMVTLLIVAKLSGWTEAVVQGPTVFLSYIATVLVSSWLIYSRFELPAQRWLRGRLFPDRSEPALPETWKTI